MQTPPACASRLLASFAGIAGIMLSIHGDPTGIPVLMLAISCECFNLAIQKGSRPILYVAYIIALFAAIFLGVIINWNSV